MLVSRKNEYKTLTFGDIVCRDSHVRCPSSRELIGVKGVQIRLSDVLSLGIEHKVGSKETNLRFFGPSATYIEENLLSRLEIQIERPRSLLDLPHIGEICA